MAFLQKIQTKDGTIGIWKLSEDPDILLPDCPLTPAELKRYKTFTSIRRRKEFLATRHLLSHIHATPCTIFYDEEGKPVLDKGLNISIAHSHELAVVFLSHNKIGIDVEQQYRNIDRITKRFLAPGELEAIAESRDKQTAKIIYWCAKEAIFKCSSQSAIQFNTDINIVPFSLETEGSFQGIYKHQKLFELHYFSVENNIIVSCVEKGDSP